MLSKKSIYLIFISVLSFSLQAQPNPSDLKKYVGMYSWINAARFRVYLHKQTDNLMVSITEEGIFPLKPLAENEFSIEGIEGSKMSFTLKNDVANEIKWILPSGKVFEGSRIKKLDKYAIDVDSQLDQTLENKDIKVVYSEIDSLEAKKIFSNLSTNYPQLCKKFDHKDLEQILVKIYPSKSHYGIGVNLPDRTGSLLTATEFGRKMICMTSPRTLIGKPFYELASSKGIIHEFIHVLHRNYDNNAFNTGWLYEGAAIYVSKCCHDYKPSDLSYLKKDKRLSFKKINADFTFRKKYEVGSFIVAFIDETYGWQKVVELMKNGGDAEKTFGVSQSAFETKFYDYINEKYF